MKLELVKALGYSAVLLAKIDAELTALEKESLLKKIDRLFSICQPEKGFNPFTRPFKFDRDRLVRFDQIRHGIVHGGLLEGDLDFSDDDLLFLMDIAHFLTALVNLRFGTRMDPATFLMSMSRQQI